LENITIEMVLFLFATGFLAAFIDSVVGGGGMISLPALLSTGLPPTVALGTNKLASTMGSLTSTISFIRSGKVNGRLVSYLFPLAFFGSCIGVIVVQYIPTEFLEPIILVLLSAVAIYTIMKKDWGMRSSSVQLSLKWIVFICAASLTIGFYDGFLGPGTGSFLIFSFLLVGYNFIESAGNAKVLNFASNIAALLAFIYFDSVHFSYGLIMGGAMVFGAIVGSRLAIRKGASYVKILFIIVTVALIAKTIWNYLQK